MLHSSEMCSMNKENKTSQHHAEMIMMRWLCGAKLNDKLFVFFTGNVTAGLCCKLTWCGHFKTE